MSINNYWKNGCQEPVHIVSSAIILLPRCPIYTKHATAVHTPEACSKLFLSTIYTLNKITARLALFMLYTVYNVHLILDHKRRCSLLYIISPLQKDPLQSYTNSKTSALFHTRTLSCGFVRLTLPLPSRSPLFFL